MVVPPGGPPRAEVSDAAESWPGFLQPLPPTTCCLKKERKERKKVGEPRGQGTEHGGETKVVSGEGNPRWGRASVGVRV